MNQNKIDKLKAAYDNTKSAKIGDRISCPTCGKSIVKKTKDHAFCSNGRSKGAGNCKDGYWNKVDPVKRNRDTPWKRERDKDRDYVDEGPEGWDGHKD